MAKNKSGFTLIELIVVISLCMLLCCVSLVSFKSFERSLVGAEMQLFCAACNSLQQQAIVTNTIQELSIDAAHHTYSCNGHGHTLAKGVYFDIALDAYGPPSAPHKLLEKAVTFKENKILFYPEGMMSAGMVCFTNSSHSLLYAISSAVAHISFLRCYSYDKGWKLIV